MKKVLIISYCFPPDPSVSSLRAKGFAKYLMEFGWDPIILTKNLPDDPNLQVKIIKTPYSSHDSLASFKKRIGLNPKVGVKKQCGFSTHKNKKTYLDKISNTVTEIIAYPDTQKGWYEYAVKAGNEILKNEKIDAIISTSSPLTCHLVAHELKSNNNIPWIADLRDLWTQNHHYQYSFFRKYIERKLELQTLSTTDALTTVSQPLVENLKKLHKEKNVFCIHNGFDPEEMNIKECLDNKFTITYTGTIYVGKQDPEPLFEALYELIAENQLNSDDLIINFYGSNHEWLEKDISTYNLQNIVNLNAPVTRQEALKAQRKSQVLLLLNWNDPNEKGGIYTAKIFEYLAAQRPILSIGSFGGVIKELLDTTNAGANISDVNEIKEEIKKAYNEFKSNGQVTYHGNLSEINKYSHREMARRFAEILDNN